MQKWPRPPKAPASPGRGGRRAEVPTTSSTGSRGGRAGGRPQRGSVPRTRRPRAPRALVEAGGGGWGVGELEPASEQRTAHWAGKERTGLESRHVPGLWGPPRSAPATPPPRQGVPGTGGRGGGNGAEEPPSRRPGCREKRRTPGLGAGGRTWSHNFLRPEGRSAGVPCPRSPWGVHAPRNPTGTPSGWERREETGAGEERGADLDPAVRGNSGRRRLAGERGRRGPRTWRPARCAPSLAPRPAPRALPAFQARSIARAAEAVEVEVGCRGRGLLQPAPRSAFGGFGSNPAGRGRAGHRHEIGGRMPRPPRSLSAPPRPLARPKAFIFPYAV